VEAKPCHASNHLIHDIIAELIDALSGYDDVEPTDKHDQHNAVEVDDDRDSEVEKVIPLKPARRQATAMNVVETRVQEEPPPGSDQSVVCVASRGPLDQGAGMMLAQILSKHSLKVEMVKHHAVSRSQIDQLHCTDAAIICICYIDAGDATSQLRYLIRRLRQRVPTSQVLVAVWPSDHPARVQKERQESLGADYYVSSVRAAVDICLASSTAFKKRASVTSNALCRPQEKVMKTTVDRRTVDLTAYPDLVVIYLGMRVRTVAGIKTLLGLGPQIDKAGTQRPDGLLHYENNIIFKLYPLHIGIAVVLARF